MANIIIPPGWRIPDREATSESRYFSRRSFLKGLGFAGSAGLLASCIRSPTNALKIAGETTFAEFSGYADFLKGNPGDNPNGGCDTTLGRPCTDLPAFKQISKNSTYAVSPERALTPHVDAIRINNYYEMNPSSKYAVWRDAQPFQATPWGVEVSGLVDNPRTVSLEEILNIAPLQERIYRFRCVEAWAMTVPWVGYPLSNFMSFCKPKSRATHVRFHTVFRPSEMPGQLDSTWFQWPYYEGLSLEEANNELALLTLGLYGKVLPNQNGAPVRIIVPWKYGYKSPKAIVKVEFVDSEPPTFWNDLAPSEYGFLSNVEPTVPHPRWSQANETLIDTGEMVPTLKFNGYEKWVGGLYT